MNGLITEFTGQIKIGAKQVHRNMTLMTLIAGKESTVDFITLDYALEREYLVISEISNSGSVPELKVVNTSDHKILLLDGEEIVGAKQNRALNTTILLAPKSENIIPVSCVEHGRWRYSGKNFKSESRSMSACLRREKAESVTHNLRRGLRFVSDQGRVWEGIERKYMNLDVNHSPTMAMSDLYESVSQSASDYLKVFSCVCGQIGMIVLIDSEIAGLEIINRFDEFKRNHRKLVNSYVMDALETAREGLRANGRSVRAKAGKFLESLKEASFDERPSVALGRDFRLESSRLHGSGLKYEEQLLQVSVFPSSNQNISLGAAGMRRASSRRRSNEG